jgi:hypothetical protein
MPSKPKTLQLDLFSGPRDSGVTQTPQWDTLPAQTRQTLTSLIACLLLNHGDDPVAKLREVGDDL